MHLARNAAASVFLLALLFVSPVTATNAVFESCDALSFIGPAVDQQTADNDCETWSNERDCDEDCESDNTPTSIHGEQCDEFYWTIESLNQCDSQGQGNFNGQGFGWYTQLTCVCFWDFPGQ